MKKHRVLLVCSQHLFGAGIEGILRVAEDIELSGPCGLRDDVCLKITETNPNVVLIVEEDSQSEVGARLMSTIMDVYPKLPIIRAGLTENIVRVYSTHILPARGTDLIETIRNLSVAIDAGGLSTERSEQK